MIDFYKNLRSLNLPLDRIFQQEYFCDVPVGWYIIISDVKNSTDAVNAGKHNVVNLVAAGSLIAGLNIARKNNVEIPFFFGGDGSTLIVPGQILKEVLGGLRAHNQNAIKNFQLEMHIGSMSMEEVMQDGHFIKIAKLEIDRFYNKAIIIGDGLRFAEFKIKQEAKDELPADSTELNLTGLECRWNKVKPKVEEDENICYLIEAVHRDGQLSIYPKVFAKMEELYGDVLQRSPLSTERLQPLLTIRKLKNEMLAKFGQWNLVYFIRVFLGTLAAKFYFKYNWSFTGTSGKQYLAQLIAHADTLTVDGRINTIICGTTESHRKFLDYLLQQEEQGMLIFGHYASKESIMTCYIENRNSKHIHFVDGADGGYTEAAKEFKQKMKQLGVV